MQILKTATALWVGLCVSSFSHAADKLILGVQDYGKTTQVLVVEYKSLAAYLSKQLGQPVVVQASQNYERHMANAKKKRFAFIYGPPTMAIEAYRLSGYEPVAKIPGVLSASFMSLSTSNVAFPEDMKGKRIGMPDDDSLVAKLAMAKLRSLKMDSKGYFARVETFSGADDVIKALELGLIDVGVASSSLFNVWSAQGHNLNVVLASDSAPHLTFSVKNDLSPELKAKLIQALLLAHQDPGAQSYFKSSGYPNFEATSIKDYQNVIKLLK